MTQQTTTQLRTDINSFLPDNTSQLISPQDVRDRFTDVVDSIHPKDIVSSGTHSGAIVLDLNHPVQNITLDGHVTLFTTTSRDASLSKSVKVRLTAGAADRNFIWSGDWKWLGTLASGIPANRFGMVTLASFGSAETDVIAAYQLLGSGDTV